MFQHEIQVRVRYAETDQMGYVYYGNYATYFEVARVEALRALGFSYKKMEQEGIIMPVLELKNKFIQPGYYDELLTIRISIPKMPSLKIVFHYEVIGEDGREVNHGETTLVFVKKETGKPIRMPAQIANLLAPYFE